MLSQSPSSYPDWIHCPRSLSLAPSVVSRLTDSLTLALIGHPSLRHLVFIHLCALDLDLTLQSCFSDQKYYALDQIEDLELSVQRLSAHFAHCASRTSYHPTTLQSAQLALKVSRLRLAEPVAQLRRSLAIHTQPSLRLSSSFRWLLRYSQELALQ